MNNLVHFTLISLIIVIGSLYSAYLFSKNNPKKKDYTFVDFLNDGKTVPTIKDISVGLAFGTALGFVDTLGIWIGVEQIGEYIVGRPKIKAALGGLYSNILGLSIGTAASMIMNEMIKTKNEQRPIYLSVIGSIIGAIFGIIVGRTFFA
jgi:hypothetical protein